MANTLKPLAQSTLTGSAVTYYTVPAATTTIVKTITVCNGDAAAQTFNVWLVADGESEGDKNALVKSISLAPSETVFINPDHYLTAGYKIMASGSDTQLGMTISGVEMA